MGCRTHVVAWVFGHSLVPGPCVIQMPHQTQTDLGHRLVGTVSLAAAFMPQGLVLLEGLVTRRLKVSSPLGGQHMSSHALF